MMQVSGTWSFETVLCSIRTTVSMGSGKPRIMTQKWDGMDQVQAETALRGLWWQRLRESSELGQFCEPLIQMQGYYICMLTVVFIQLHLFLVPFGWLSFRPTGCSLTRPTVTEFLVVPAVLGDCLTTLVLVLFG